MIFCGIFIQQKLKQFYGSQRIAIGPMSIGKRDAQAAYKFSKAVAGLLGQQIFGELYGAEAFC